MTIQGLLGETGVINAIINNSKNGVFDANNTVTNEVVGEFEIRFTSCTTAIANYSIEDGTVVGEIDLIRLTTDTYCESLLK